jgi:CheY-like chemotaxis protein
MKKNILIIDDSPVTRMIIKHQIPASENFEVTEAENGIGGLELFKKNKFDLVLLDLTMPEMDGFETLVQLKKVNPDINVVIITSDMQSHIRERVMNLGAAELLNKPPNQEQIKGIISKYL